MYKAVVVFASVLCATLACDDPDGTKTKLFFKNCDDGTAYPLTLTGLILKNAQTGQPEYPITVTNVILISENSTLGGTTTYNKVKVDVDLYSWGGILGCSWHYVPTFGLLHNIDGCAIAQNCPLKPGFVGFNQKLDLGPFGPIIQKLGHNQPYQLKLRTKENDDSAQTYIGCVLVEGVIA